MKLTQFNTKIFIQELDALQSLADDVKAAANAWIKMQESRDKGMGFNPHAAQGYRTHLESLLNEFRIKMAMVYDFQGDRGMVDFAIAEFVNQNGDIPTEEVDEVEIDPIDFSFFPQKQVDSQLSTFYKNYYGVAVGVT